MAITGHGMNCDDLLSHQKVINQTSVKLSVDELGGGHVGYFQWTCETKIAQGHRRGFFFFFVCFMFPFKLRVLIWDLFFIVTMWKSFSKLGWYPNFPQGTEISQSKLWSTKQTRPSNDTELLADGDVAWDYTPALDLTFSVFFECKPARRPHIQRADPSFEKEACRSHA